MKNNILLVFFLLIGCWTAVAQNVTTYSVNTTQPGYTPITTGGGATLLWNPAANTDDQTTGNTGNPASPTLPFAFVYGCTSYASGTALSVSTNGWVAFGQTTLTGSSVANYNNTTTPQTMTGIAAPNPNQNVLWPFWEDLMLNIPVAPFPGSQILTQTLGVTPNRVFVIQFQNMDIFPAGLPSAMANYQVRLYETSNKIAFDYGTFTMTDGTAYTGTTATVGIQAGSTNAPTSTANFISVTPNGPGGTTYSTTVRNNSVNPLQQGASPAITNGMEIAFSPGPNDVSISLASLVCGQLCFNITNNGCAALPAGQTIPIAVQIDGGSIVNGTLTLVSILASGATVNSCTAGAITGIPAALTSLPQTPTASGVHVVSVTISPTAAIDGVLTNNFIQGIYTPNIAVTNATPYCTNFDADGGGWTSVGTNPFVLATNGGGITSATQAWHSNSTTTADLTKYILQSPCFNLSSLCNPRIAFDYGISNQDSGFDGFKLQYTTNNGTTWSDIPDPAAACNFSNWTPGATSSTNILSTSTTDGPAFGGTNDGWTTNANPGNAYANLPAAAISSNTVFRVVVGIAGGLPNMDMYFDNFRIWDMAELSMVTLLKPAANATTCPATFDVVVRLQNNQTCSVDLSKYNIKFTGTIDKPAPSADQAVTTLAVSGFVDATVASPVATTTIPASGTIDIVAFTGLTMNGAGQYVFGNTNTSSLGAGVLGSVCFNVVPSATFFSCTLPVFGIGTATNTLSTSGTAVSLESNAGCTGGVAGAGINNCLAATTRTVGETADLSLAGPATICEGDELIIDAVDAMVTPNTLSPLAWYSLTAPNKTGFTGSTTLTGCNNVGDLPTGTDNLDFETLKITPVAINPLTSNGTYYYAAIAGAVGACRDTAYITVTVQPKPALSVTGILDLCVGENLVLSATDGNTLTAALHQSATWGMATSLTGIPFVSGMFGAAPGTVSTTGSVLFNDTYTETVTTPGLYYYAVSVPTTSGTCDGIAVVCVRVIAHTPAPIPDPASVVVCVGNITILHATSAVPAPTTINGFNGPYSPAMWLTNNVNDDLSPSNGTILADTECLSMTSGNQSDNCNIADNYPSITEYCITAAEAGTISFDWWYSTNDDASYDYPAIDINGAEVWPTVIPPTPMTGFDLMGGNSPQNGSYSTAVAAGDILCIRMYSEDNTWGAANFLVSNFVAPIPSVALTINWYDAATGGTLLGASESYNPLAPVAAMDFVTPVITQTTSFFAESNLGTAICRDRVEVIVTAIPNIALTETQLDMCLATPPTVVNLNTLLDGYTTTTGTVTYADLANQNLSIDWYMDNSAAPAFDPTVNTLIGSTDIDAAGALSTPVINANSAANLPNCETYYAALRLTSSPTLDATSYVCIPPAVKICIAPAIDVAVISPIEVCSGATSGDLSYVINGGVPNEYSIDFDATAEGAGFVDVPAATALPVSPIAVTIPAAAPALTYDATITFTDNITGCFATYPFEVVVNPEPSIAICTPTPICVGATSVVLNYLCPVGSPDQYSIDFDDAAITDVATTALPASPITLTVPGTLAVGVYTGTVSVLNSTTGCSKDIIFSFEVIDCCPNLATIASQLDFCVSDPTLPVNLNTLLVGYAVTAGSATYANLANQGLSIDWYMDNSAAPAFDPTVNTLIGSTDIDAAGALSTPVINANSAANLPNCETYYAAVRLTSSPTLDATSYVCIPPVVKICIAPAIDVAVISPIEVCSGATSGDLSYVINGGVPNEYSIDFDATAEGAGFVDVPAATALPVSPIAVTIPAAAPALTYDATITFTDNITGCFATYPFGVVVNPEPSIAICTPTPICVGATSVVLNYLCPVGSPDQYSIDFDDAAITDIATTALPASPITLTVPGTLAVGVYTGTVSVLNSTTGCSKDIIFSFEVIDCCPDLTTAAPVAIVSSQSTCTANVLSGGVIAVPATTCPTGSTLQYSTDGGATWSTTLPTYDQDGPPQTISTRCNCDLDNTISSPISSVMTVPGICPPLCAIEIAGVCAGICSGNQYDIQIFVVSSNGTGDIEVSIDGGAYGNATSPDADGLTTVSVTGLTADGSTHTVDVRFVGNTSCAATQVSYTAPASCTIFCTITSVVVVPGTCNDGGGTVATTDDYYTATVVVNYTNAAAGTFNLTGAALAAGGTTSSAAIAAGSGTVVISGVRLLPNLAGATVTATHSATTGCTLNSAGITTGTTCSPAVCGGANAGTIVTGN